MTPTWNKTDRGLYYHSLIIYKFFDEWDTYQGFLGLETAFFVHILSSIQSNVGIFGGLGEIGVAAGKSFITMAMARRSGEPLFVCDIFGGLGLGDAYQKEGVVVEMDNAAQANLQMFLDHVHGAGVNPRHVAVHDGPSSELNAARLFTMGVAPFRLFHIDGGHYYDATLNDLRLAACTLVPGGIIMLDDLNNGIFPGVQEAFHYFMLMDRPRLRPDLVPFLHVGRLYLADRPFADVYRKQLREQLPEKIFWQSQKEMYGAEVLLLAGGLSTPGKSVRAIVSAEEDFFKWPARWRVRLTHAW